mmetsp:Transcript_92171/g.264172  ORF Transcript_92171/g.264172 Transcript_92171/m.264172 type:complete len:450 (+) Transcript_92171:417-1766(+)
MLKAPACGSSIARPSKHFKSAGCRWGSRSRNLNLEKTGDSSRCTSWSSCLSRSSVGSKAANRAVNSVASSYCWDHRHSESALTGLKNQGSRSSRKRDLPSGGAFWGALFAPPPKSASGAVSINSSRRLLVSAAVSKIQLKVWTSCFANSASSLSWGMARATVTYKRRALRWPQRCRIMSRPRVSSMARRVLKSLRSLCVTTAKRSRPSGSNASSSSRFRPSMICANTHSVAATTSSFSCSSVLKMGSNSLSSVALVSIFSRLRSSNIQIHCKHTVLTSMLCRCCRNSFCCKGCRDSSSWSSAWSTGRSPSNVGTMSKRLLFISTAIRRISSSWSPMQRSVAPRSLGSISTHFCCNSEEPSCGVRWMNSSSQHRAVSRMQAESMQKHRSTTIPAVSEMIFDRSACGFAFTPFSSSFRQASALCLISRDWSPNMLSKLSRYCGRYWTMYTT